MADAALTDGASAGAPGAVEFWDLTNRQDWAACESVQRGLASPHFRPGPFAPSEDAVAQLVVDDRRGLPHRAARPRERAGRRRLARGRAGRLAGTLPGPWPAPAAPAAPPAEPVQVGDADPEALQGRPARTVRHRSERRVGAGQPGGRHGHGRVRVRAGPRPVQPALGTLVPHEGGPGYSTTGTGAVVRRDVRPAARPAQPAARRPARHRPVASRSTARRCRTSTSPTPSPRPQCGRSLGDRADDYTTALSADDLAAVVARSGSAPVDLYGDSYGTFFAQVFAGRHPEPGAQRRARQRLPDVRRDRLVPHPGPGDARRVHRGLPALAGLPRRPGGRSCRTLRAVLAQVRAQPWRGTAYDADGRRMRVTRRRRRRWPASRSARRTHRRSTASSPLRCAPACAATARRCCGWSRRPPAAAPTPGRSTAYSEGLDAAVACHDYPQLYDMTAPPGAARERQLRRGARRADPHRTPTPTARSPSTSTPTPTGRCSTGAPGGRSAPASNPAGPPLPPGGRYPDVPVLVLSGELDSITTAAEGDLVARAVPERPARRGPQQLPRHRRRRHGRLRRAHRAGLRALAGPDARALRRCAKAVEPVRALGLVSRRSSASARTGRRALRPGSARRPGRCAHRRRRHGPVVEQLQRPRRRAARRHLQLHRRPGRAVPAARSAWCRAWPSPAPRSGTATGETHDGLASTCRHGQLAGRLGHPPGRRPRGADAARCGGHPVRVAVPAPSP